MAQRKLPRSKPTTAAVPPTADPVIQPCISSTADWANLSPNLISKIFRELEDPNDRTNAALVCRKWSEAFASPELWRALSIQFLGNVSRNLEEEKALKIADNFGQFVRELQIMCFSPDYFVSLGTRSQQNLIRLIEILAEKSSQIRTISLNSLHLNRYWEDEPCKEKMLKTLSSFLMSQNQILNFSMAHLNSEPEEGLQLLESIADKNQKKIERLNLQNFFADSNSALNSVRYRDVIRSFETLVELTLNYGALDQLLLKVLVGNCSRTLKDLKIACRSSDNNAHSISPQTWKWVVDTCPHLEVEIQVIKIPDFLFLLTAGMPLKSLKFFVSDEDDVENLNDLLQHLKRNFTKTLANLHLEFASNAFSDVTFLDLVRSCPKLRSLYFSGDLILRTIIEIFRLKVSGSLKLDKFEVELCGNEEADEEKLGQLVDQFEEKFQVLKVRKAKELSN